MEKYTVFSSAELLPVVSFESCAGRITGFHRRLQSWDITLYQTALIIGIAVELTIHTQ